MSPLRVAVLLALAMATATAGSPTEEAAPRPPEVFARALADLGISVDDLGYRPRAHWARYPHPNTTPHVLPFFNDLLAHPLDTYEFTRLLGNAVEDHLTPAALTEAPEGKDRKETLFRLGVILGTDRLIGGFRGYSANLDPRPTKSEPLLNALITLLERSGKPLRRPMAFGAEYGTDEISPRDRLESQVAAIPEPLRRPLAKFVLNLIQAREWIDLGLRHVPREMREAVFAALPKLAEDTPDGTGYHPVFDDVAKRIDAPSLYYGCLKALQATQDARRELGSVAVPERGFYEKLEFELETPWGRVQIGTNDTLEESVEAPFLVVAVQSPSGGSQRSSFGATGPERTLSVALLLDPPIGVGGFQGERIASGILGCGVVYAAGAENMTRWHSDRWGLGAGMFGLGALIDEGGHDSYHSEAVAQGAGFFGIGLLLDAAGDDFYELGEGDGQGFGGPGGVGILGDRSGDDRYYSEPDAALAGRADYHSAHEVAVSNAQGVGSGRRGDGSDGHNWAGGLGALLDVAGRDRYRAGNFSQGLGYWYGTGLLWDGGGDDDYRSVYFTQGSGAHFAIGALIDESGNDVHLLEENAGAAFAFGWDVVNAFLIDRGNGNDRYVAKIISTGLAEVRSNAFFLDEGGNDIYVLDAKAKGFGDVDQRKSYDAPGRTHSYPFHLTQVGVFLDLGGEDRYLRRGRDGRLTEDEAAGDNRTWNLRTRNSDSQAGCNLSLGRDVEAGHLGFLAPWPPRNRK